MRVYEGAVVTCDVKGSVKRFLVEDRGRIVHTGDALPPEYANLPRRDLGGGALLPAFADTHMHFMSYALFAAGLDVREASSVDGVLSAVRDFAARRDDPLVIGFGVSPNSVKEKRLVTREELDRALPDRPLFLVKYDGHACVVNSRLLRDLPPALSRERGFNADSGLMFQDAFFRTTDYVTGKVSLSATLGNMLSAADGLAEMGIGMIHSVSGVGFPRDLDVTLESLFARGLRNPFQYRLFFQTLDEKKVLRRKLPRIGGCFAAALDGCFGSVDAALKEPYRNDPANKGVLYYPDGAVRDFAIRANRAGLQIEMHAIGDAAFDQAVLALDSALSDFPREDHRHTIIHGCLPTDRGLDVCARRGIAVALQPAFLRWNLEPEEYLGGILGERTNLISPLRRMTDLGITLSGGSDAPCTRPDPLYGIWAACNHPVPGQSLSAQEALNLYTRNAAWTTFDEKERGSLEPGKIADMTVLDVNPLAVERDRLRSIKAEELILSGKPYRPGQGRADLLVRGLVNRARRI